jgi:hypothetical protein
MPLFRVKVKRTGRVRGPNLADPQLRRVGTMMVAAQKGRWAHAVDADGNAAKKLSVRYAIIKQKLLHKRPVRDNKMTGLLVSNFQLRKAADGVIRAEPTTTMARKHALGSQGYVEMIGFAVSDAQTVFTGINAEFGQYAKTAWIPLGETQGAPWS